MGLRTLVVMAALSMLAAPGILAPSSDGPQVHRLADLDAGGAYRYDVTLIDTRTAQAWTTTDHLTVRIGPPSDTTLLDGTTLETLTLSIERRAAPWDAFGEAPWDPVVSTALVLAREDGAAVQTRTDISTGSAWYDASEGTLLAETQTKESNYTQRTERIERVIRPVPLFASGAVPGMLVREPGDVQASDHDLTPLPSARAVGLLDGVTVLDLGALATAGDGPFGCPTPLPLDPLGPPHVAFPRLSVHGHGDETTDATVRAVQTWVDPRVPLPVLIVCDATLPDADNQLLQPVQVVYRLREHQAGRTAVPIAWNVTAAHPALKGHAHASAAFPDLHFPFKDLLLAASDQDEEVDRFLAGTWAPELVMYEPRRASAQDPGNPLLAPIEKGLGYDAPHATPTWSVRLVDVNGEMLEIEGERRVYEDTTKTDMSVWSSFLGTTPEIRPAQTHDPQIGSIMAVFARALQADKLTAKDWEHQDQSGLYYARDLPDGTPIVGVATGLSRDGQPWESHVQERDARDGALVADERTSTETSAGLGQADPPKAHPASGVVPSIIAIPDEGLEAAVKSGAAFGLTMLLVYFWDGIKAFLVKAFVLPLYAKLRKERLLDHTTREEILNHLCANPGAHKSEIRKRLGIGLGTASHHLDVLEKNGLVASVRSGRARCYFAAEAAHGRERALYAVLSADATRRVYRHILHTPGVKQRALAERLGVSQTAIIFHVRKLVAVGAVEKAREGRYILYRPTAAVRSGAEAAS